MVAGRRDHAAERHAVFGERACLVGEDDPGGPERFHGRQPVDQGLAAGHQPHAAGQGDGGHDGQALGNGGDAQGNGRLDHQQSRPPGGQPGQCHHGRDAQHGPGQARAELVQAVLQGRGLLLRLLGHLGDSTEFGLHAGGHHDALGRAFGDRRAAEDHAVPLGQRDIGLGRLGAFDHGHRLAGQGGLIHAEVVGFDQSQVGRGDVAAFLEHHVAGHQVVDGDFPLLSVAADAHAARPHFAQGLHRADRPPLGGESDQPVEQHDRQYGNALGQFPHGERQHGGYQEHHENHALELIEQDPPGTATTGLAKPIWAEPLPPLADFGAAEPRVGIDAKLGEHFFGRPGPGRFDSLWARSPAFSSGGLEVWDIAGLPIRCLSCVASARLSSCDNLSHRSDDLSVVRPDESGHDEHLSDSIPQAWRRPAVARASDLAAADGWSHLGGTPRPWPRSTVPHRPLRADHARRGVEVPDRIAPTARAGSHQQRVDSTFVGGGQHGVQASGRLPVGRRLVVAGQGSRRGPQPPRAR